MCQLFLYHITFSQSIHCMQLYSVPFQTEVYYQNVLSPNEMAEIHHASHMPISSKSYTQNIYFES